MKPQDILFLVLVIILLIRRDSRLFVISGIIFLFLSMPLFAKWIFFTAERFTWYAAFLFLIGIILYLIRLKRDD